MNCENKNKFITASYHNYYDENSSDCRTCSSNYTCKRAKLEEMKRHEEMKKLYEQKKGII